MDWIQRIIFLFNFVLLLHGLNENLVINAYPYKPYRLSHYNYLYTSKSIRPNSCKDNDGNIGVCMFSLACRQANGISIGICKDTIYAGSCCKLRDPVNHIKDAISSNPFIEVPIVTSRPFIIPLSSLFTFTISTKQPSSSSLSPPSTTPISYTFNYSEPLTKPSTTPENEVKIMFSVKPFNVSSTIADLKSTDTSQNIDPTTSSDVYIKEENDIYKSSLKSSPITNDFITVPVTTQSTFSDHYNTMFSNSNMSLIEENIRNNTIESSTEINHLTSTFIEYSKNTTVSQSNSSTFATKSTETPNINMTLNNTSNKFSISSPLITTLTTETLKQDRPINITNNLFTSTTIGTTTSSSTSTTTPSTTTTAAATTRTTRTTTTTTTTTTEIPIRFSSTLNTWKTTEKSTQASKLTSPFTETTIQLSSLPSSTSTRKLLPSTSTTTTNSPNEGWKNTPLSTICGRKMKHPRGRIVGGTRSAFAEWPWMVSLRQWKKNAFLHKCGAALLNDFWAITAAHCVENVASSDLLLRLGEYDVSNDDELLLHVDKRVQIVAPHPRFDPRTFEYDLALLRLQEPINYRKNILPVCLPEGNKSYVGQWATVTGWGRLYEDGPLPNTLQHVEVPVIPNKECESMYRRAGYIEDIPNIFICAGLPRGGKDSCEGDSGGPLVVEENGQWSLIGIISWGIGCASPNQPGVYTRITEFAKWIRQIIEY